MALDLTTRIFIDPGDVILAEAPSYVGALGTFQSYQAQVVHVAMDDDGLIPEALVAAIETCQAAGRRIKLLYTIPNFHNPAGVTLSDDRRGVIAEICRRAGIAILEDNPYGLLGFDDKLRRAIRADDADNVIYLGSFSKTFAPGLRVGWVLAPHAVREKLVLANESATLNPPVFNQMMISRYLEKFDWLSQIKAYRHTYAERRDAMLGALDDQMPAGTTWTHPDGGFYVWVTLPGGIRLRGDAAASGHRPGRLRARNRLLRRRSRFAAAPAVVLLPDLGADRRGRAPARHGAGERAGRHADVRHQLVAAGARAVVPVAGYRLTVIRRRQCRCERERPFCKESECMTRHVVILAGGLSHEREVSLRSGSRLHEALRGSGVEVTVRDTDSDLISWLAETKPDAAIITLHGSRGENGAISLYSKIITIAFSRALRCAMARNACSACATIARAKPFLLISILRTSAECIFAPPLRTPNAASATSTPWAWGATSSSSRSI